MRATLYEVIPDERDPVLWAEYNVAELDLPPICGQDFCEQCDDCLYCYGGDEHCCTWFRISVAELARRLSPDCGLYTCEDVQYIGQADAYLGSPALSDDIQVSED